MRKTARRIGCATSWEASDIPADIPHYDILFPEKDEWVNPGDAVVFKPFGGIACGPMRRDKGLLMADVDVATARAARRKFDVSGHYPCPDVFSLRVDKSRTLPVSFS
jgi:nitrilase